MTILAAAVAGAAGAAIGMAHRDAARAASGSDIGGLAGLNHIYCLHVHFKVRQVGYERNELVCEFTEEVESPVTVMKGFFRKTPCIEMKKMPMTRFVPLSEEIRKRLEPGAKVLGVHLNEYWKLAIVYYTLEETKETA